MSARRMIGRFPDLECSAASTPHLRLAGVSHRGASHKAANSVREDSFEIGAIGERAFIAVADGVGSQISSHIGASIACTAIREHLDQLALNESDHPTGTALVSDLIRHARSRLIDHANATEQPLECLATTLQIVVIDYPTSTFLYGASGDGHTIIRTTDSTDHALGLDRPSPIGGTTNLAVPDPQFDEFLFLQDPRDLGSVLGCCVFTDGVDRLFLRQKLLAAEAGEERIDRDNLNVFLSVVSTAKTDHEALFKLNTIVGAPEHDEELDDDKTLVIATFDTDPKETS